MRIYATCICVTVSLVAIGAFAAEPKTIDELKEHFSSVSDAKDSFTADYTITMDVAAAKPSPDPVDAMAKGGKIIVRGESMWMSMSMIQLEDNPAFNVVYTGVINGDNIMHMQVTTPTSAVPPMRMNMGSLNTLAKKLGVPFGVPAAALNSEEMSAGLMINPTRILDSLGAMYDLKLAGKETLKGEEVYVIESRMKPETLEKYKKNPEWQWMFDVEQKIYLGVNDGVLRKMTSGGTKSMELSNINFGARIDDSDFTLKIAEGTEEIDMTNELLESFSEMADQ
tara:strand:- start:516 stop:1361 length:846 start_codon:yes stop_codon:yes gene_type:complete